MVQLNDQVARVRQIASTAEARTLAAFLLCGLAFWGLAHLGSEMHEGETAPFDRAVMLALRLPGRPHAPIGPSWAPDTLRDLTALGSATLVTLVTAAAAVGLLLHRRWGRALLLTAVVVLASACDDLLKTLYQRARPDFAVAGLYAHSQSFPSGHSTDSAALWLTLAGIAASFEARIAAKLFWFALALVAILAVGFSRVYLGAHWPTDVLGGWILGAAWALAGWIVWMWLASRRAGRGGVRAPPSPTPRDGNRVARP